MNARLAVHLSTHQLPEFQRAARVLLGRPLITNATMDDFRLIRRWESILRTEFGQKFGYRLDVSRTAARLLRRPTSLTVHRAARLTTGRTLTRWAYIYFALILAALEQPGTQVLASELLDRIVQSGRGDDRLRLDATEFAQRRAFRDAVRYLEQLGVLKVRDGDIDTLTNDGQVLFDIDRDAAAMCLVASPSILREVKTVADFIDEPVPLGMEARARSARQRLNRRLIDQPVVMLDDLDNDEVELAWKNRRREADNIARVTGCDIEIRREGMALIDHHIEPISSRRFPGADAIAHAALLWLDELIAAIEQEAPALARERWVSLSNGVADRCWNVTYDRYASRFNQKARQQPEQFREMCASMLTEFGFMRRSGVGVEISAFASRFRAAPLIVEAAAPHQESMF